MKIRQVGKAEKISVASVVTDTLLAVIKLSVGTVTGSHALISDGIHSCADIFSSSVVLIGSLLSHSKNSCRLSSQKAETISLFILSLLLGTTGMFIGTSGFCEIFGLSETQITVPPAYALCVSVFALFCKELMFFLTFKTAKKEKDDILLANAWHHQSDALSCLGSFFGIFMSRLGFPKFDPIASIAICAFIMKTAVDIFLKAVKRCQKEIIPSQENTQRVQNKQK